VSADTIAASLLTYHDESGKVARGLVERLAVIGTLDALSINGVFDGLMKRDGKPRNNNFMPRQQLMLARNLRHPAAAEMRSFIADTAPFILEANE